MDLRKHFKCKRITEGIGIGGGGGGGGGVGGGGGGGGWGGVNWFR